MSGNRIQVHPIAGALGAEIEGVDLASDLDDDVVAAIRRALLDHLVIFFRDQHMTPAQQAAFGRRFGELDIHRYAKGLPDNPEVMPVIKEAADRGYNFGGAWHTDVTFYEEPPLGSLLYALEVPPFGGDTLFANQYLAYETLSAGLRATLDGLQAVHSARRIYGLGSVRAARQRSSERQSMKFALSDEAERETTHPVVRTHPETGRKCLYVNCLSTQRFAGMTEEESRPLLDFLYAHAARPEFACRFRWRQGSVAFWDNRCTQHFALNDYHGYRREMHRVTICGDRPF